MKILLFSSFLALLIFAQQVVLTDSEPTYVIDFSIAYMPRSTGNIDLIEKFSERVEERTDGNVKINIVNLLDKVDSLNKSNSIAKNGLMEGNVGMSQILVQNLNNISQTADALIMPMIFRDRQHVSNVINGQIGNNLKEDITRDSNGQIKTLAFSYEGFEVFYITGKQSSIAELRGIKTRFNRENRSARDIMHILGIVQSDNLGLEWDSVRKRDHNLVETTGINVLITERRRHPDIAKNIKNILLTNHAAIISVIAMHGPLFDSLDQGYQVIIQEEANRLAEKQRGFFSRRAYRGRKQLESDGINFIEMSSKDKEIMENMARKVYTKYRNYPVGDYIQEIINTN